MGYKWTGIMVSGCLNRGSTVGKLHWDHLANYPRKGSQSQETKPPELLRRISPKTTSQRGGDDDNPRSPFHTHLHRSVFIRGRSRGLWLNSSKRARADPKMTDWKSDNVCRWWQKLMWWQIDDAGFDFIISYKGCFFWLCFTRNVRNVT